MRKTTLAIITSTALILPAKAISSGIPVIDVAGLTQSILQVQHALGQIQQLKDQVMTAKSQLDNAQRQLNSISGSRGLANVIDSTYDIAMDVDPAALLNQYDLSGANSLGLSGKEAELFNLGNESAATYLAQSQKSIEQSQARFTELSRLINKVNDSPEQKDILDLQARISAEEVMLQNEMTKLTMLRAQAEANESLRQQQITQQLIESSGSLRNVNW